MTLVFSPSDIYRLHLKKNNQQQDSCQISVLQSFDRLSQRLNARQNFFSRWRQRHDKNLGIYLWGTVGIGKTFIMDCFFDSLTTTKKRRIHFHHFMQEVHAKLQQYSGNVNPLALVVKSIHVEVDVLCLDEFFVSDIVDAMLLTGLLEALFKEGVYFVTTSNIPPEELYKDGLRRDNFLPAIRLLKENVEVIHLNLAVDYRLHYLKSAGVYYTPLNNETENQMTSAFQWYGNADFSTQPLLILDRKISVIRSCAEAAWFDFEVLCGPMRSKQDYLALAKKFPIIFISNIPVFNQRLLDEITCFIQLIDILYDAKIKLVASAEATPNVLYTEGKLTFAFQRIASRLIEMQSEAYFLQ
jgi:cell division protein ZapE